MWFFFRPNGRKVVLGVHSLSQAEDTKQIFDILELHNHPNYNTLNYDNDIALIKVRLCFHLPPARDNLNPGALSHSWTDLSTRLTPSGAWNS